MCALGQLGHEFDRAHKHFFWGRRARRYADFWNLEHPHVLAYGWHAQPRRRVLHWAVVVVPRRYPID